MSPSDPVEAALSPAQEIEAMRAAVAGECLHDTFHAYNWSDKPHRVLWDALRLAEKMIAERDAALRAAEAARWSTEPPPHTHINSDPVEAALRTLQAHQGSSYEAMSAALRAAEGVGPRWRHKKRGTVYVEVGRAELQIAGKHWAYEGDTLVIYRGEDGKLWAREAGEFEDGRFSPLPPAPGEG